MKPLCSVLDCMSGSGTRSTPVVYGKTLYSFPLDFRIDLHVAKGVLNRRFKRRFAFFAAVGKEGRAGARNFLSSHLHTKILNVNLKLRNISSAQPNVDGLPALCLLQ